MMQLWTKQDNVSRHRSRVVLNHSLTRNENAFAAVDQINDAKIVERYRDL
jgi:hypothetical protein